jgi:hypothetical protein
MPSDFATAGGAAAAGGFAFQDGVAAWLAGTILAEAPLPWINLFSAFPESLRCETEAPVDDILVSTRAGGWIFLQAKKGLQLPGILAVVEQCVRLFIHCNSAKGRYWERPLDPMKDGIVVAVDPTSSQSIRVDLANVLNRFPLTAGLTLSTAPQNLGESRVLDRVVTSIRDSWKVALSSDPSEDEINAVLALIRVVTVDPNSADHQGIDALLRTVILTNPLQSSSAWAVLLHACRHFSEHRTGADRQGLQRLLIENGLQLQALPSYRDDIAALKEHSSRTLKLLASHSNIKVGKVDVKLKRGATEALLAQVPDMSVLLVGEPGVGKSGVVHDFAQCTLDNGHDLVVFSAEDLTAHNLIGLRSELHLSHEITEILGNWPGGKPGFVVIDALDAARDAGTARALRELIKLLIERPGRWRVLASIRKFDLRHSTELQRLFRRSDTVAINQAFSDEEFTRLCHINVPRLSDEELTQAVQQAPSLDPLVAGASRKLRELLRFPFNLRLAAELLDSDVSIDELHAIETQLQLLDRYWHERIMLNRGQMDGRADARATVLWATCSEMVRRRALKSERVVVSSKSDSNALTDLLSSQVLIEESQGKLLLFAHHVLFDYTAFRLLLPDDPGDLSKHLANDPEQALLILPSLDLYFRQKWQDSPSHEDHWQAVFTCIRTAQIPEVVRLIGPFAASELAIVPSDLRVLCEALASVDVNMRHCAERALEHLVGGVSLSTANQLWPRADLWYEFTEYVSRQLSLRSAFTIASLLAFLNERTEPYDPEQRINANRAAQRILAFASSAEPY